MEKEDAIEILSGESSDEELVDRRAILEPAIRNVIDALGGYEGGVYRLGDECYGCLKDLKKFWRKDDTDDDRTVARIFWDARVLSNDLIPIIMETAGKGLLEDKCAIACADLMTAMTWPIDLAEELKELDEQYDKGVDYTQLLLSHLHYKAALLKPGIMQALFGIMVSCLAKDAKERKERDIQIINVILYLVRNLAFIKDLPPNMHLSSDQADFSSLQSRLAKALSEANVLDLLLTIASNATTDSLLNGWNALLLEIFYLLFRGVKPSSLAMDQTQQPTENLRKLLAVEDQRKRDFARKANTRHSRFGTTISVKLNPKKAQAAKKDVESAEGAHDDSQSSQAYVLHRQQAINREAGEILDMTKRHRAQKSKKVDELGREDNLSFDAKIIMQNLARTFVEACFNPFLSSLLKDIKAERPKITEKDNLRLLYVTKWFLEFFLCVKTKHSTDNSWDFGLIAEVTERDWIVWVLKRMRGAVDEKPKAWNELQAGIECLTQLVLVIDAMSSSSDPDVVDVAEVLQQQIIYNGEVLDIAFESMRTYKEGTQSLTYLDASIHLGYALLRMLEKWGKKRRGGNEMYVRRKAKARRKKKGMTGDEGVPDVEEEEPEEEEEDVVHETMFTFDMFQTKFAHPDITHTLLAYVARYKEFTSPEQMKRVVNLLHRQAVKVKAEGLFFNVSTLDLFKAILADERSLSKDAPYKDLIALINFILRQFFKAVENDSFLIVEAFFPKNRGHWKQYSSWEPEKPTKDNEATSVNLLQEVQVKKGYTWSEQLAIAIACLVERGKMHLVNWVKRILMLATGQRQRVIEDTDGSTSQAEDLDSDNDDPSDVVTKLRGPSSEAMAKIMDYMIPYVNNEEAEAATKDPHLKLLFRLMKFKLLDEGANELEWFIPAAILPAELQRFLNLINQFLGKPLDLEGKKASEMLSKKRRRRRRRSPFPEASDDEAPKEKKEKRIKEKQQYKSAQFIEDSDVEYGNMESFLEKEKTLRQKTALAAASTGHIATMKSTGTKKRRKKTVENGKERKRRRKGGKIDEVTVEEWERDSDGTQSNNSEFNIFGSPRRSPSTPNTSVREVEEPKPRPHPRPRLKRATSGVASSENGLADGNDNSDSSLKMAKAPSSTTSGFEGDSEPENDLDAPPQQRKKGRLQLAVSDDED